MTLLSDGTVIAQGGSDSESNNWYRLTPDSTGSYTNGTWTTLASSNVGRLFYASDLLPDGRLFTAGGEDATDQNNSISGEIYNPATNQWSTIANYPETILADGISETLPGGQVLQGGPYTGNLHIYDPSTNQWSAGPGLPNGDQSSEEGWVKLADGSTLDYEIQGSKPQTANRLVLGATEAQDQWVSAGSVPVALASNGGNSGIVPEIGPGLLLPSGNVFWVGASGHTAIYTPPSGNNTTGTWTQGKDILDNNNTLLGGFDAPGAVEPDGDVLFAAGPIDGVHNAAPTTIFEYDPNANTITEVTATGPNLSNKVFVTRMLDLPSGQVLFSDGYSNTLYAYNPTASPSASWAPTVSAINWDGGNSFTLTGTQLNGLSQGAAYGDDAQMASNYPIIKLTASSGNVTFATTSNWSSEWVATGSTPETTNFTIPAGDGPGVYTLRVIANGIASEPVVLVVGSSANDSVTLDTSSAFGFPTVTVDFNGATSAYFQFLTAGVFVLTEDGSNSVGVRDTLSGTPTSVVGDGSDTVYIEDTNSSVRGILGTVTVTNPFDYTSLVINDIGDSSSRSPTLTAGSLIGLAPAPLYFQQYDLNRLEIYGGSGGNGFTVQGTPLNSIGVHTYLTSGTGSDTVYVQGTNGPLSVDGANGTDQVFVGNNGSLAGIAGAVNVFNYSGADYLYVYDYNDTTQRHSTLNLGSLTWTSYAAPITWVASSTATGGVTYLVDEGGSGSNIIDVDNTDNFYYYTYILSGAGDDQVNVRATTGTLYVDGGGGIDTVQIGSTMPTLGGTVAGILGAVHVSDSSGASYLYIDDGGDTTGRSATMNDGSLTWASYAAPIYWTPTSNSTGGVYYLTVQGGSGGNTWTILNTSNFFYSTDLETGTGSDVVYVKGTTGRIGINGDQGYDYVYAGSANSIAGIKGAVTAYNNYGSTYLYINDSADTTARTATISDASLTWTSYAAPINWTSSSNSTGGVTYLAVSGGSGGNTFTVTNTSNFLYYTNLNTGSGSDLVNVEGTTGELYVDGDGGSDAVYVGSAGSALDGSQANIHGAVDVYNGTGSTFLYVDDGGDATGRTSTVADGSISYSGYGATIDWTPTSAATGGVTFLEMTSGSGADTINVAQTSAFYYDTYLDTGAGNDTVNVKNTKSGLYLANAAGADTVTVGSNAPATGGVLSGIGGFVDANYAGAGTTSLILDDSGDSVVRSPVLTSTSLTGLAPVPIDFTMGKVTSLVIDAGTGANTLSVSSLPSGAASTFKGGSGVNSVIGPNSANTWTITGNNAGNLDGSLAFTGVANLIGGTSTDAFRFAAGAAFKGKLDGGAGANSLDYSSYTTAVTVNLGLLVATGTTGFANIQSAAGGSASDTLIGTNAANTWAITGANAGNVGGFTFASFENLNGGTSTDSFQFSGGASVAGKLDGGAGVNTLDYSSYPSGVIVNLTSGAATGTGGVANIQNVNGTPSNDQITGNSSNNVIAGKGGNDALNGGPGGNDTFVLAASQGSSSTIVGGGTGDTIQAANVANTWTLTGAGAGNIDGIAFNGITNLTGGTSTDAFKFAAGSVGGKVDGGLGVNTLDYSGDGGSATTVNLATLTATRIGGFANIQALVGSTATSDALVGPNTANAWNITGAGAGNVNGTFTFSGVESLAGGTSTDAFRFAAGAAFKGKLDGGAGANSLDYSSYTTAVTVNLGLLVATGTTGFANIQSAAGGSASDTLIGTNAANTWAITGANAGNVGGFTFASFENLNGGTSTDLFVFSNGASVAGKIVGGGGSDWLDYGAYTTSVTVDLTANTATGTGGIANIADVRGGAGNDTLKGNSLGNILIGGGGNDTIVGGSGRSILIGGGGNDTVTGGSGDDIVIGGTTSYDPTGAGNDQALAAILAEWQSSDSYATRISKIKAGVAGGYKFDFGTTVLDDGATNRLTGGAGNDWFFKGAKDTITDLAAGENVN